MANPARRSRYGGRSGSRRAPLGADWLVRLRLRLPGARSLTKHARPLSIFKPSQAAPRARSLSRVRAEQDHLPRVGPGGAWDHGPDDRGGPLSPEAGVLHRFLKHAKTKRADRHSWLGFNDADQRRATTMDDVNEPSPTAQPAAAPAQPQPLMPAVHPVDVSLHREASPRDSVGGHEDGCEDSSEGVRRMGIDRRQAGEIIKAEQGAETELPLATLKIDDSKSTSRLPASPRRFALSTGEKSTSPKSTSPSHLVRREPLPEPPSQPLSSNPHVNHADNKVDSNDPDGASKSPTDFEVFIAQAEAEERAFRTQLWRAMSQRSSNACHDAPVPRSPAPNPGRESKGDYNLHLAAMNRRQNKCMSWAPQDSPEMTVKRAIRSPMPPTIDLWGPIEGAEEFKRPSMPRRSSVTKRISQYIRPRPISAFEPGVWGSSTHGGLGSRA